MTNEILERESVDMQKSTDFSFVDSALSVEAEWQTISLTITNTCYIIIPKESETFSLNDRGETGTIEYHFAFGVRL